MSDNEGRTRREMLADTAKAAAAAVAGVAGCFPSVGGKWPAAGGQCSTTDGGPGPTLSPAVVEVFNENSLVPGSRLQLQPAVVAEMLTAGLATLAEQVRRFASRAALDAGAGEGLAGETGLDGGAVVNPWTTLLPGYRPGQRIGIKVNCLGVVANSPALVRALIASLVDQLGVDPAQDIVVWDRYLVDITSHGKYAEEDLAGARLIGNLVDGPNYEKGETDDDPKLTAGIGYGPSFCEGTVPRGQSLSGIGQFARLTRILTHETDLTINCTVFKSHNVSGITGALKSVYGMIHNPGEYHKDFNTVAPQLYAIPAVRNSIPLTICEGIIGVMQGDPASSSNCQPKRILLSQDPVALDSYIHDLMDELLAAKGGAALGPLPWLDGAAALGLGSRSYELTKV